MSNLIARMISVFAPLIHESIVTRLSNNKTFQDLAWHGTSAAKEAAERGKAEVKNSKIYQATTKTVQEKVNTIKQTETFQQLQESDAGKFVSDFVGNVKKELQQAKASNSRLR